MIPLYINYEDILENYRDYSDSVRKFHEEIKNKIEHTQSQLGTIEALKISNRRVIVRGLDNRDILHI